VNEILTDLSPATLAMAIEANLIEFFRTLGCHPAVELHDDPEMLWASSSIRFALYNFVTRIRLTPDGADHAVEAAIARCKERGMPMAWVTGPQTQPPDLSRRLQGHGFSTDDEPGMAADLLALKEDWPVPSDLGIERVADAEALRIWSRVTTLGFGMPEALSTMFYDWFVHVGLDGSGPMRHYLGRLRGEPVATSTLFLGAGVTGIYRVATLPDARGQGIGTAITLAALREGRAEGYRVATLHASPMGVNIYRRMGFQEYCTIGRYLWTGR